jgi:hypothetical protein
MSLIVGSGEDTWRANDDVFIGDTQWQLASGMRDRVRLGKWIRWLGQFKLY